MNIADAPKRKIFTVTELTNNIKEWLETAYPFVWVTGEISNLHFALSGHCYFTLKDAHAQISAVMFRGQNRSLRFTLENGLTVVAMGRLNVYEAKGVYQLILEYIEPAGLGALQLAFQQLRDKLEAEGLFREERKRSLPALPRSIAVITSPKGAAIHDIFSVIGRRYSNVKLQVVPVAVQGTGAEHQIVAALSMVNRYGDSDLIILARGGGSLEDLQPYNTEGVARAVAASDIPVVTGIGHETDITIADLAADLRAPTPSAAAELAVPERASLERAIETHRLALQRAMVARIESLREKVRLGNTRLIQLIHPAKRVAELRLRLDDLTTRVHRGCVRQLAGDRQRLEALQYRLNRCGTKTRIEALHVTLQQINDILSNKIRYLIDSRRHALGILVARLNGLNPLAILERGYSVTRNLADGTVIKDVRQVDVNDPVSVTLYRGEMVCSVKRKKEYAQTNL